MFHRSETVIKINNDMNTEKKHHTHWLIKKEYDKLALRMFMEFVWSTGLAFIFTYMYQTFPVYSHVLHGLVYVTSTYAIYHYTGAVLNPFITLAIAIGGFHKGKLGLTRLGVFINMLGYFLAHTLGALCGCLLTLLFNLGPVYPPVPNMGQIGLSILMGSLGSCGLTLIYLFVTDAHKVCAKEKNPNQYFGLAIGGYSIAMGLVAHTIQGGILNAHHGFVQNIIWTIATGISGFVGIGFLYWGMALIGTVVGAFLYWGFMYFYHDYEMVVDQDKSVY